MFKHSTAPECNFKYSCNKKLCQFQHCDVELPSEGSLETSIRHAHPNKCSECEKTFKTKEELDYHVQSTHKQTKAKVYPCEKCNFTFESKVKFQTHLSGIQHNKVIEQVNDSDEYDTDDDDEEFSEACMECGVVFKSYESLDDHHSNYLSCQECQVCFHNEFQWDNHKKCERL